MQAENSKIKILIVDDEVDILEMVQYNLGLHNYIVKTAINGIEAIQYAKEFKPNLILLDMNMPKLNGIETCLQLRANPDYKDTIIIFLTAMASEEHEIKGLNIGADDYIIKPIKPQILISRIKSALRRLTPEDNKQIIEYKDLKINKSEYKVEYNGTTIIFARKEFQLLSLLASKPTKVFDRMEILNTIWGNEVIVGDRTIDVHVRKIRQKLDDKYISTIKGVGYKLEL
jgi:two-component system, OmpR family, alkaline phosphatase synthesis response regulator PhoP